MEFKRPADLPLYGRRGIVGRGRGERNPQTGRGFYVENQRPPYVTINKTRSRARSKKRFKGENYASNVEETTDSDIPQSEDESIQKGRIYEMSTQREMQSQIERQNKNKVEKLMDRPSTSKDQMGRKKESVKVKQKDLMEQSHEEMIEEKSETYSNIVNKNNQSEKNIEIQKTIYKDSRAEHFLRRAVWFTRSKALNFSIYVKEIERIIGKNNIEYIQVFSYNKVEIYVKLEEYATKLAIDGIMIEGKPIRMFHLTKYPINLYINGLKPWIEDTEVIQALKNVGYCEQKSLERVMYRDEGNNIRIQNGVRIMSICRRPEIPLPKVVQLYINGDVHKLDIVPEYIKCHNCGLSGHIVNNCLNALNKRPENENYNQDYPLINFGNYNKEQNQGTNMRNEQKKESDLDIFKVKKIDREENINQEFNKRESNKEISNIRKEDDKKVEEMNEEFKEEMQIEIDSKEKKYEHQKLIDIYAKSLLDKENKLINEYINIEEKLDKELILKQGIKSGEDESIKCKVEMEKESDENKQRKDENIKERHKNGQVEEEGKKQLSKIVKNGTIEMQNVMKTLETQINEDKEIENKTPSKQMGNIRDDFQEDNYNVPTRVIGKEEIIGGLNKEKLDSSIKDMQWDDEYVKIQEEEVINSKEWGKKELETVQIDNLELYERLEVQIQKISVKEDVNINEGKLSKLLDKNIKTRVKKRRKQSSKEENSQTSNESLDKDKSMNFEDKMRIFDDAEKVKEHTVYEGDEVFGFDEQVIMRDKMIEISETNKDDEDQQNENLKTMEKSFQIKDKVMKNEELIITKNIAQEEENEIQEIQRQEKDEIKGVEIKQLKDFEELILEKPKLIIFFKIIDKAYKLRRVNKKTYPDEAMGSFKLYDLIETVVENAGIYDNFGKLGDVQNLIKAKIIYDKEVKTKLLKQKTSVSGVANLLGYASDVEVTIKKIDYWQQKIEVSEIIKERQYLDDLNRIQEYIHIWINTGVFPKDDMTNDEYKRLGETIYTNMNYIRKNYKLKLMISRLMMSKYGRLIVKNWDERTKRTIKKYCDVSEFNDLILTQKKVITHQRKY